MLNAKILTKMAVKLHKEIVVLLVMRTIVYLFFANSDLLVLFYILFFAVFLV